MTVTILFASLFLFLLLGIPIVASIGAATLLTMYFTTTLPLTIIAQKAFSALDSFPLLAIPFFMLAGLLMGKAGVSQRLLNLATILVGWMVGGLAMVTVLACMFFAAISGSGPATVAAIGSFMIPTMREKGYNEGFAGALTAAAGSIGVLIPPSIPFVIYGVIGGVSVGGMFLAGIIPGVILGIGLMVVSYFIAKKKDYKPEKVINLTFKEVLKALYDAKWALLIPVIILGGIYGGVFSPTEAAVVAVVYSLIIGLFVHKELSLTDLYDCFKQTVIINTITMIIISFSITMSYIMIVEQIPGTIASFIMGLSNSPIVILLIINVLLLIVGMFFDTISALVVLTPILLPIVTAVGIDPMHFGVIMVANLAIGFITPPLGANLYVASSVSGIKVEKITRGIMPFLLSLIICLLVITFVPILSTWLPGLMQ
ncbi:TRAP transporter large permease [Salipaludibacillus sp. CF4.18]|uniref:TRAP transporter large permease n=1 Tax=Salipaludibacillus sp. CF4.18 TaxID=3373081 RepID=UPI003EE6CD62